ncbi:anti-sigma factor [Methylobacterium sp. J-088]|uniref:anti-sigma factor n=1 Tax=Methylobacterium sp. J-088 TaxID=2836664 RepID=UPI001FBAACD0|nr:anti-sigma factor [Methylobacterium sp. J-088]MCJ2061452.1 anti-sigma factor [Methylobacterium sp. J-088]
MSGGQPGLEPTAERDILAAEYALGTLDAQDRAALEREASHDHATASRIGQWERRLAPLMGAVPSVPPPPRVREALLRALPDVSGGPRGELRQLRRQVRRWQVAAAGSGLLAAGLALFVAVAPSRSPAGGRYLAVVQGGGALPALVVRVDTRTGLAQVRPVGADAPAGRSLEVWYVGAEGAKPLGLVGAAPSQVRLPQVTAPDGVIAVSVEPPGGSPSGQPTGPVIYTGKLIAE